MSREGRYQKIKSMMENPGVENRPLQIIHSYFPQIEAEFEPFIKAAKDCGLGGFVINVGSAAGGGQGAETDSYLDTGTPESDAEWERLRKFAGECLNAGLRIWIYDEKAYPSGAAGNKVIKDNPEYRVKGLKFYSYRLTVGDGETKTA